MNVSSSFFTGYTLATGVYTEISGRLSEEPFPWLIQKFPCILLFKTGQPGRQLNLSEGQIRLDLTSEQPLVWNPVANLLAAQSIVGGLTLQIDVCKY